MDEEASLILSTFQRVPYLVRDRFDFFCDHRNLAYIFSEKSCGVTLSKAVSQRLVACVSGIVFVRHTAHPWRGQPPG